MLLFAADSRSIATSHHVGPCQPTRLGFILRYIAPRWVWDQSSGSQGDRPTMHGRPYPSCGGTGISDREQQACNLDRLRGLRDQAAVHSGLRGPCTVSSSRTSTSGCDKRPYSEDVNWKNRKQAGEGKYKILQARGCIPESMNLEALASAEHSHYTSWPRSGWSQGWCIFLLNEELKNLRILKVTR